MQLESPPKYQQMADDLRAQILAGDYPQGTKLKTDVELAAEYGINKRTVANGMSILVSEGLISRTPGRGTVVERTHVIKRSNSVIGCLSESTDDVYEDLEKEITIQTLKKGFYPLWVPQSLFNQVVMTPNYPLFRQFLEYMINDMPYGLIVHGERFVPFDLIERNRSKVNRLVFINQYLHTKKLQAKYVLIDYDTAARQILTAFAEQGHTHITFWGTDMTYPITEQSRPPQQILLDAMNRQAPDFGIRIDNEIPHLLMTSANPETVMTDHLLNQDITGVVLGIDAAYYEFDRLLTKHLCKNWREQMSFIGFFNTKHARKYNFSSIDIQERQIAKLATEMLFDETDDIREIFVPTKLVDRQSIHEPASPSENASVTPHP